MFQKLLRGKSAGRRPGGPEAECILISSLKGLVQTSAAPVLFNHTSAIPLVAALGQGVASLDGVVMMGGAIGYGGSNSHRRTSADIGLQRREFATRPIKAQS